MADFTSEHIPGLGGLNTDDDPRFMDSNDSKYRLNVINSGLGTNYVVTNILGNTLVEHSFDHHEDYVTATYTTIGDCYDSKRNSVYFFIYSDQGNDSILRYNFADSSFDKICWDHTDLGFDLSYPIADAYMIGDWLHWNPRTTSPRSINVTWAYYDFISYGVMGIGAVNRVVGDYVKDRQRVYVCTATIADDEYPVLNPASYSFVSYTYDDVYPVNAVSMIDPQTAGEYHKYRNFYNTPTSLPYTPAAVISTDTDYEYNNIRGRVFQFCYRHYVPDQGYTITSSFTDIIAPPSAETDKGEVIGDIQAYNKITLSFPVGVIVSGTTLWWDWDELYEFVEVLFREGPDDDWKVAERMSHSNVGVTYDATYNVYSSIEFYNDKAYEVVDNVMVEKQYTPLPITSKAQWALDGERTAYGYNKEGFDPNVDVDVTMATGARKLDPEIESGAVEQNYPWTITFNEDYSKWSWVSTNDITTVDTDAGDVIQVEIGGVTYTHILDAAEIASFTAYRTAQIELLAQGGIIGKESGSAKIAFENDVSDSTYVTNIKLYAGSTTNLTGKKFGSYKNGAWHPKCLYYYDEALRRSEPVFNDDMRVYMENLSEVLTTAESTNYQRYIDWTITHLPPQWAKYWRWGYAGNQTVDKFWQYNINELAEETKGTSGDVWTKLDISPLQLINDDSSGFDHYFPDTEIEAYSYVPGDRVRFITDGVDSPADQSGLSLMSESKDYEIKEFDDITHSIYIEELVEPGTTTTTVAGFDDKTFIIEIYRPKKQTGNTVYYEYGPLYKTYADAGVYYHRGETQDQTEALPALGQFTKGDVWVITRLFSESPFTAVDEPVFVESYSWSDFQITEGWGKGKTGFFTGIGQQNLNNIRYSNRFSPNTKTGGLSTFDFLDYKEMSVDHGDITAMRQAGNTLKVYFERNSASVLVNKQQLYDADGTSSVVKSDNVLGDAVYSNYHYGTIFPESVMLKDRTVFFYDIYRDSYIKDSSNGLSAISHNKMKKYFDEKSAALLSSGVSNIQVWSTYDFEYDMVYVHFIDAADATNDEVILYHEPQDRWISFLQISDAIQEAPITTTTTSSTSTSTTSTTTTHSYDSGLVFGRGSMKLVSYIGDAIYIHNDNAVRNNFWGSQRDSIVEIVANESPNIKKTFEAIALHTNKPWVINYIGLPEDGTYTSGMQSKLPETRFRLMEGIYTSNYLRNMKTYSSTASNLDLIRGETLRGYYAEHRLVNDDTTEVTLFKVDITGNVSRI